MILVY